MTDETSSAGADQVQATGDIHELRGHLLATLRGLRDKANPLEPDRARAISQVAGVIVDSVRAETEAQRLSRGLLGDTGFIRPAVPNGTPQDVGQAAIRGVTRHLLKDD